MYKNLISLCLLLCFNSVFAQDTLVLATGREQIVNVVIVEGSSIK